MSGRPRDAASWLGALEEVVATHLGAASTADTIAVSASRAVFLVTSGASRFVVKLATAGARPGTDYAATATAQDLARRAGLPVAEVVAVGGTIEGAPLQYVIQEHVDGIEWRKVRPRLSDAERADASAEIAQMLVTMQTIDLPGFGSLAEPAPQGGPGLVDALHAQISLRVSDGRHRTLARRVLQQHAELFRTDPRPTLTHDDLHHANLLFRRAVDGWHLVAVLDWDKAWAGPAESDLARMAFWDDMTDEAFWSVYRASVRPDPGWAERAMIYQLLWCLEYEATTARHRADTAALLAALA